MNKVTLVGNLGNAPELRQTGTGKPVANFSVATNETWQDAQGNRQQRTEWHRIVVWGKLAETCGKYLAKGRQVLIEGRIQTSTWDDNGTKRYRTEIIANQVHFLDKLARTGTANVPVEQAEEAEEQAQLTVTASDCPF